MRSGDIGPTDPHEALDGVGRPAGGDTAAEGSGGTLWRHLADQLPDAIATHDTEGTYLFASRAFAELFGWRSEDLVGRDPYELFHPDDVPEIQAVHAATLRGTEPTTLQYRFRCADGSYRWVETTNRMTDDGQIVAVTRRIAHRRSLLQALDNERMVAERLRQIDLERQAFLTAIAHRARHPMTVLSGFAQLLQSGRIRDESALQPIYERLVANTERLSELIEATTTADELSRRANELRRAPVDLARLARETAADWWDLDHPEETAVTFDLPARALVFADRERLTVALRALYHNAVKHTPIGTDVLIRIEDHPDGWLLAVEDNGPGVPDRLKSAIFDRLAHGDPEAPDPGLGLGLYLVDQIARAHNGRAWVEDHHGGGASFRILLPTRRSDPRTNLAGSPEPETPDGR